MGQKKWLAAAAAIGLTLGTFPGTGGAANASSDGVYQIVALGDSLTAGYQYGMKLGDVPYGYVDRLFEQALFHGRSTKHNYGIIGLTTPGLGHLLDGVAEGKPLSAADLQNFSSYKEAATVTKLADDIAKMTPAIKSDLATADAVVVTIGANDFMDFLRGALAKPTAAETKSTIEAGFEPLLTTYKEEALAALRKIHILAPDAALYVSDQYLPVPNVKLGAYYDNTEVYNYLYAYVVPKLTETIDGIVAKLQTEGVQTTTVHVADDFKGNESTYTTVISSPDKDIHPNAQGYEVIAKAYADAMWREYRQPAPLAPGAAISVIVQGKEVVSPYKPVVKPPGVTFLALTDVMNALGITDWTWDVKTRTVSLNKNGRTASITIGAKTMLVNGQSLPVLVPAYLQTVGKEKKTYVPLAVIAQAVNYQVEYSKQLKTSFINS